MTYGGIEASGTKWVCAIGSGPNDLRDIVTFPTPTPKETIARAADFFANNGSLAAVGIGSFGPIDIRRGSPTWGRITRRQSKVGPTRTIWRLASRT
jgi:fructokinase